MLSCNVVTLKDLRSFAGKLMNIASLLVVWRPFLSQIWGALSSNNASHAPLNCVWTKQFKLSLLWMHEFLAGSQPYISRTFNYWEYYGPTQKITITTDASPFGIGGWLEIDGKIVSYFAGQIYDFDCEVLERPWGECISQQVFEALALLVAFRLWFCRLQHLRSYLSVRTDNRGALAVVSSLKGSGSALTLVARELALDLASCTYFPHVLEHLPGVANVIADVLSRKFDPNKKNWALPTCLEHLPESVPVARSAAWWRTKTTEDSFATGKANSGGMGGRDGV